ncbi:MAG: aldehyde dehydrogenase family protein [Pseudomonadota bacterium]
MTLDFDPDALTLPRGHFIAGQYRDERDDALDVIRASDGKRFAPCAMASADKVDEAVSAAKRALADSGWMTTAPRERARALHRWADAIEENRVTLAQLEAAPSTRPISAVLAGDIPSTVEQIRFFAELADKEGGVVAPTASDALGLMVPEPYGVVGAITPWNYPVNMAGWKLAPALAAGNAVVLKPSELTPFSTAYLAELWVRAGLPSGLINVVQGDGPTTGAAITGHPGIAKVSFTGSTRAGGAIMETIARSGIKPMTLELGGKSPQIVFADADLDLAAGCIAASITSNGGQACVAGSRLIVEARVSAALLDKVVAKMAAQRPGLMWNEATTYSPIISETQRSRVASIVADAIDEGAQVLTGGVAMDHPGYFYSPTVLDDLAPGSRALMEEVFGPVLSVQRFDDEDEALSLAQHPIYGLCAGIYTKDLSRAVRVSRGVEAGTVWLNRYGRSRYHVMPTGGFNSSGFGKDLGKEAYAANQRIKSVLIGV